MHNLDKNSLQDALEALTQPVPASTFSLLRPLAMGPSWQAILGTLIVPPVYVLRLLRYRKSECRAT